MMRYRLQGHEVSTDDPRLSGLIASAYAAKERPVCLCRVPGLEMYIAKVATQRYLVKRMPNSGAQHDPQCEAYEPPAYLSGLGEVSGRAIQEDADSGTTTLKLDFSLSKAPGRAPPASSGVEADSVKADATKLSLRGMLHFLWEEAGFNRWHPGMEGKRNWRVVRHFLLDAAAGKATKGMPLADALFLPESFSVDEKDDIQQRRSARLAALAAHGKTRPLMVLIGEVKEFGAARYGKKAVIKHLPDMPIMLSDDLHGRLTKRFEAELSLWQTVEGAKLVIVGTFGLGVTGIASFEEVALMAVSDQWIPFETLFEAALLQKLTHQRRRFLKGLRYNMPSSRPLASVVLSDTQPKSVALYIMPADASIAYRRELADLLIEAEVPGWLWCASGAEPPSLPDRVGYVTPADLPALVAPDPVPAPAPDDAHQ